MEIKNTCKKQKDLHKITIKKCNQQKFKITRTSNKWAILPKTWQYLMLKSQKSLRGRPDRVTMSTSSPYSTIWEQVIAKFPKGCSTLLCMPQYRAAIPPSTSRITSHASTYWLPTRPPLMPSSVIKRPSWWQQQRKATSNWWERSLTWMQILTKQTRMDKLHCITLSIIRRKMQIL